MAVSVSYVFDTVTRSFLQTSSLLQFFSPFVYGITSFLIGTSAPAARKIMTATYSVNTDMTRYIPHSDEVPLNFPRPELLCGSVTW